jgi:hypothetical protein
MRYPNLRYGRPSELEYYAMGIPIKQLSKRLRRSEKSIQMWLNGKRKVPWWVPEILRLQRLENLSIIRQMGCTPVERNLMLVSKRTDIGYRPFTRRGGQPHNTESIVAPRLNALKAVG